MFRRQVEERVLSYGLGTAVCVGCSSTAPSLAFFLRINAPELIRRLADPKVRILMSIEELSNSPLQGLKAETMVTELVAFYGWDVLYAALRLNCLHMNPSISSCLTFLKKTEWARHRVENFYLYRFKRMPKARGEQFDVKPRERGFPDGIVPREPMELTVELIEEMRAEAAERYKRFR